MPNVMGWIAREKTNTIGHDVSSVLVQIGMRATSEHTLGSLFQREVASSWLIQEKGICSPIDRRKGEASVRLAPLTSL